MATPPTMRRFALDTDCGGYCERFSDAPPEIGRCRGAPPQGTMHINATLRDLTSRSSVASAHVRIVGALAAVSNPVAATPLAETTTGADGRLKTETTDADGEPLGLVAIAEADGYFLTGTGLAQPLPDTTDYPFANQNHDVWLVPTAALDRWSAALASDATLAADLPLGEKGGIVGLVRNGLTGDPLAGAVVSSSLADSGAQIRYLAEDGASFAADMTSSSGLFIILKPGLAEGFRAEVGGTTLGPFLGGSAESSIFALVLN